MVETKNRAKRKRILDLVTGGLKTTKLNKKEKQQCLYFSKAVRKKRTKQKKNHLVLISWFLFAIYLQWNLAVYRLQIDLPKRSTHERILLPCLSSGLLPFFLTWPKRWLAEELTHTPLILYNTSCTHLASWLVDPTNCYAKLYSESVQKPRERLWTIPCRFTYLSPENHVTVLNLAEVPVYLLLLLLLQLSNTITTTTTSN